MRANGRGALCKAALGVAGVTAGLVVATAASAGPSFDGVGHLAAFLEISEVHSATPDGAVVVGISNVGYDKEAFRWTSSGGIQSLGDLPGGPVNAIAEGVSADGATVVGSGRTAAGFEAFRWTESTGLAPLGFATGGDWSAAVAVSADGSVIVGNGSVPAGEEAMRWTAAGGWEPLGELPGSSHLSVALGASADGSVVTGWSDGPLGTEAFRWTAGTGMVGLGDLPGSSVYSIGRAVSPDGLFIAGQGLNATSYEAFIWSEGTGLVGLGGLPAGSGASDAHAVSNDGSFVAGRAHTGNASSPDGYEAFLWSESDGMRLLANVLAAHGLDLAGWTLTNAAYLSPDGRVIAGTGISPSGATEGWVAIIPEPATGTLLGLGVVLLARRRR